MNETAHSDAFGLRVPCWQSVMIWTQGISDDKAAREREGGEAQSNHLELSDKATQNT